MAVRIGSPFPLPSRLFALAFVFDGSTPAAGLSGSLAFLLGGFAGADFFSDAFDALAFAFLAGGGPLAAPATSVTMLGESMFMSTSSSCFLFFPFFASSVSPHSFFPSCREALYCAFAFLSRAAYSFFSVSSNLAIAAGTTSFPSLRASNSLLLLTALVFEAGSP